MAMKWHAAWFKTSGPAQVSIRVAGKEIQRLELPTGVTISICYEGTADAAGFEKEEVQDGRND